VTIADARLEPTFDPHEALRQFIISVVIESRLAMWSPTPLTAIPHVDSPTNRAEIEKLQDQLLENSVEIERLLSGRKRPPNKSTLLRPAFVEALRDRGFPEDQIISAYDRFQAIYEPASPATQRVRRHRTREALQKESD
jgi:hypothetical protein